jgi:type I restriction enzyme S subunit
VPLGDLLLRIEAGKSFQCQARPALPDEWGVIKVSAMTRGVFMEEENKATIPGTQVNKSYEIRAGDILLSRANTQEYVGASVLVGPARPRLLLSDKSLRLVPAAAINRKWLSYLLSSPVVRSEISARATGTKHSMRNISQEVLRKIEVNVPPPAEQERIVLALEDHLSRIDAGWAGISSVLARSAMLRARLTEMATTGGLAAEERTAVPLAPAGVDDGILPGLPPTWRWERLGDIADVTGGVTKDAKKQANPEYVEVPYLRVANVQRGRLDLREVTTIRIPVSLAKRLCLQVGDVLLNEGGDRDKLGRGWIWEGQIADCVHQNHVFRARIRDNVLHPRLLAWHANGFGQRWCEVNGKQSVNLASISLSKIKLLPVPIPPRDDQERLVNEIEARTADLDAAVNAAEKSFAQAGQLRRAVLKHAVDGRLDTQLASDEPASSLMDQVQHERVQAAEARRPARRTDEAFVQETLQ